MQLFGDPEIAYLGLLGSVRLGKLGDRLFGNRLKRFQLAWCFWFCLRHPDRLLCHRLRCIHTTLAAGPFRNLGKSRKALDCLPILSQFFLRLDDTIMLFNLILLDSIRVNLFLNQSFWLGRVLKNTAVSWLVLVEHRNSPLHAVQRKLGKRVRLNHCALMLPLNQLVRNSALLCLCPLLQNYLVNHRVENLGTHFVLYLNDYLFPLNRLLDFFIALSPQLLPFVVLTQFCHKHCLAPFGHQSLFRFQRVLNLLFIFCRIKFHLLEQRFPHFPLLLLYPLPLLVTRDLAQFGANGIKMRVLLKSKGHVLRVCKLIVRLLIRCQLLLAYKRLIY